MIVCCGENLIDMVPASDTEKSPFGAFRVAPGGCPYNSAIAAARLGSEVAFLGTMAADFLGDKLYERLKGNGVRTDLVTRANRPVTLAFVEKSASGEARYAFYAEGAADRSLSWENIPARLPHSAHFLLVGSISLLLEPGATTISTLVERESDRLLVSFDPNIRPSLIPDRKAYIKKFEALCAKCAIVKASDTDLEWLYGESVMDTAVSHILSLGPEVVFLTMGEKGSRAATRRARAETVAKKVHVVDTIGAGDTFHAALLSALEKMGITTRAALARLDESRLGALLRFASSAAAINCTREGADPPTLAELDQKYPGVNPWIETA